MNISLNSLPNRGIRVFITPIKMPGYTIAQRRI